MRPASTSSTTDPPPSAIVSPPAPDGDAHETRAVWMTDADVVDWLPDPGDRAS
jgi:hypothetical protein